MDPITIATFIASALAITPLASFLKNLLSKTNHETKLTIKVGDNIVILETSNPTNEKEISEFVKKLEPENEERANE